MHLILYSRICFLAACLVPGMGVDCAASAERLSGYGAALSETSISGISSGAAMAMQFHVAHSSIVKGAGVIAGIPYDCAEQSSYRATHNCMKPDSDSPLPDPAHLKALTDALARAGAVDEPTNLKTSGVWLFSGAKDDTVLRPVMDAVRDYYSFFVPSDKIVYRNDIDAGHAMVTDDYGNACSTSASPFVDDCNFDAAKALLEHIYGSLKPPVGALGGKYIEFNQKEFLPDNNAYNHGLSDIGYAYVPNDCASQGCRVHVALHGCLQQADKVDDAFYRHAGYNRWADANHIIIVYPQTISRWGWGWPFYTLNFVWNPNACWDWWGYDSVEHHTKKGPQIAAIRAMVERLAEKP